MAKRNSGRRGRSRKRRGETQPGGADDGLATTTGAVTRPPQHAPAKRARARERRAPARGAGSFTEQLAALGERPQAPWHPLPLSELLILVGLIGTVIGVSRGGSGRPVLFAGIGAVAIGTLEFTVREHLSGYRPHTTLLSFLPTALFHSAVAVALVALGTPAPVWVLVPLILDVPVFAFLFKLLRGRFLDARQERVLAAGR